MLDKKIYIIQAGLDEKIKKSKVPARLDLIQSITGLLLALFMWGHMFFVASILLGVDAMWTITKFFEGQFIFGKAYPGIVSLIVAGVTIIFIIHALVAMRKFPNSYKQYKVFRAHMKALHHQDTTFWMWQVYTGFALFFLASAHLFQMLVWPQNIGPYASSDRVWGDMLWPYYLIMLIAVELHGGIGLYRLAVKWCWPNIQRNTLKFIKHIIMVFFLVLGVVTLAAYMKVGYEHRARYGLDKDYTPMWLQQKTQGAMIK